jgi:hypothetical protein
MLLRDDQRSTPLQPASSPGWGTLSGAMTDHDGREEAPEPTLDEERGGTIDRVVRPAREAFDTIRTGMAAAAAAAEPMVERLGQAVEDAGRSISERPGMRVRRVRRMGAAPLQYLNTVHPEARAALPAQVGLRTIPVDEIAGTAVGGGDQRGGDFLPLKPFRGKNWAGRWQRLNRAQDDLAILPPIEVVKYDDKFWVVDGHNRVALALYHGQPEIDATITELVPPGGRRTEPILSLAPTIGGSRALRAAGRGQRPSEVLSHEDTIDRQPEDDGT